jgi:hypothetical protein
MSNSTPHDFYIPPMGSGFTIDTPLAVAKYGITSTVPLLDDVLIEQVRQFWCKKLNQPYTAITSTMVDARAKRITAYLSFMQQIIDQQINELKASPFSHDSLITRYYEMLPDHIPLKQKYQEMLGTQDETQKQNLQQQLRDAVSAGNIDVNIMTKVDRQHYRDGVPLPYEACDAAAALRGFAQSTARSATVVFSAGFNPQLYAYAATFTDFFPDQNNQLKKKICLKVSDFRSALIQGKYLAKHGLWVSEFSIESPLNCGGHAFANDGQLMGAILEEFKERKNELYTTLHNLYRNALQHGDHNNPNANAAREIRITAQGGIGTYDEHSFLIDHYQLAATGWGTPFLLVPEATCVDDEHLQKLLTAEAEDIYLSSASPLGIPFWNLRGSASECAREQRIAAGTPGAPCIKGFARLDQEFIALSKIPICRSSREYQKYKLASIQSLDLPSEQINALKTEVLSRSCICHDLAGGATVKYNIDPQATTAICPSPNLINFKKLMTIKEMVNHVYGRCSMLATKERAHMFITELQLQITYLKDELKRASLGLPTRSQQKLAEVKKNLNQGIEYYKQLTTAKAKEMFKEKQESFISALSELQKKLNEILLPTPTAPSATKNAA